MATTAPTWDQYLDCALTALGRAAETLPSTPASAGVHAALDQLEAALASYAASIPPAA